MPEPKIEEITHFEFTYTPMFDGTTNIRYVTVNVYAKDRKEAELVAHNEAWKFFNLDLRCSVEEKRHGYARTNKDT